MIKYADVTIFPGVAGIELLETATGSQIGGSPHHDNFRTWIAGNSGHGISATGTSIEISATSIGFNQQGKAVGNIGCGILVEGGEPSFYETRVGASGSCGVRTGFECRGSTLEVPESGLKVFELKSKAGNISDANTPLAFFNGQRTDACSQCDCNASGTVQIDCRPDAKVDGSPPNFGSTFFSSIPPNTTSLLMPSAKVTWVDWDMLYEAAGDTLEVLDLSGTPCLRTHSQGQMFHFQN